MAKDLKVVAVVSDKNILHIHCNRDVDVDELIDVDTLLRDCFNREFSKVLNPSPESTNLIRPGVSMAGEKPEIGRRWHSRRLNTDAPEKAHDMLLKLREAKYCRDYRIWLKFADGVEGEVDLESELWGEVFEPLKDKTLFVKFTLDKELETLVWENGADFAPEFLYQKLSRPNFVKASDLKCRVCGEQAVAFFPCIDPDIPEYPYCRKCLDKIRAELILKISEINFNTDEG